ncbi:unnamed protein product [Fraxinus pennsylvanica]|uniref:Uncharacterized protein n=1 Tax=Fraxinus pennsylvanica TaxID=56036 RepID=A0AAD2ED29_9LAMI|nr:unnamed protein product [Fraxinus pennsylvanica]
MHMGGFPWKWHWVVAQVLAIICGAACVESHESSPYVAKSLIQSKLLEANLEFFSKLGIDAIREIDSAGYHSLEPIDLGSDDDAAIKLYYSITHGSTSSVQTPAVDATAAATNAVPGSSTATTVTAAGYYYQQPAQAAPTQQPQPQQYGVAPAAQALADDCIRSLWIGDLQYWMDEQYIYSCFALTGKEQGSSLCKALCW